MHLGISLELVSKDKRKMQVLNYPYCAISSNSISKMRAEYAGIFAPIARSPYAKLYGMYSSHLLPTGISLSASVHPAITWFTPKVAG